MLLPDDLIDDRDELLGPMLDVYAEHGGVVLGLLDVGPVEISKYGCVVPGRGRRPDADVVALADLVEKPKADEAPSTLAIIGRYVLPPEIFAALRDTEPGRGGEIQLTDAMRALGTGGHAGARRRLPRPPLRHRRPARLRQGRRPARGPTPRHRSRLPGLVAGV